MTLSRRTFLTLLICEGISRLLLFLLFPYLSFHIKPDEMGVYFILVLLFGFLSLMVNPGLNIAFAKYYTTDERIGEGTIISTVGLYGVTTLLLLLLFSRRVSLLLFQVDRYSNLVVYTGIWAVAESIYMVLHTKVRLKERFGVYGISLIVKVFSFLTVVLISIGKGIEGIIYGNIISNMVASIFLMVLDGVDVKINFKDKNLKKIFLFGYGLLPALLSFILLDYLDRYLIELHSGVEKVGIYSIGYKIGSMVYYIYLILNRFWEPFIFKTGLDERRIKDEGRKIILLLSIPLLIITGFRDSIFRYLIHDAYYSGRDIAVMSGLSYLVYGLFSITSSPLYIKGRTVRISIIYVFALLVNMVLNMVLIPSWGIMGAAVATFIAYLSFPLVSLFMDRRAYKLLDYPLISLVGLSTLLLFFFHL